ncbi:uncharacterized protein si:ch211-243a20.4 [Pseudorasbora parva]|uniref:uncharacterized protein si:ch211-243a20.4 n=1 Tax=Pseudorasbora parva TaxID=51549 RepID=UPI00351EBEF6
MYLVKSVLCWLVIMCCWQETQAKAEFSMLNRTRVALAGDYLVFNLSVVIPANCSSRLECITNGKNIWNKTIQREFSDKPVLETARIKVHNSSSSGNYYFCFKQEKCGNNLYVHWVVLVRDEGYQEPAEELDNAIITMMAFSGILLIFSVAGSLYILKSHKDQPPCREDKTIVAEQRAEESDDVMVDENAASESLYTALQHRSRSIYDTLDPKMMHEENTSKKNSDKKQCKAQEDDVSESIYENL